MSALLSARRRRPDTALHLIHAAALRTAEVRRQSCIALGLVAAAPIIGALLALLCLAVRP